MKLCNEISPAIDNLINEILYSSSLKHGKLIDYAYSLLKTNIENYWTSKFWSDQFECTYTEIFKMMDTINNIQKELNNINTLDSNG